jgi:hypothetical protein
MDVEVRRERPVLGGFLLAAGLFVVLVLWFGRACLPGWWIECAPTSSDAYMLSTIYELSAGQVKGGHLPLWFPEFAGGGYPVHAAWMYGLFYPPLLLFCVLPPETAWTWLSILHVLFGGLGMYAFLRAEKRDVAAAAAGAVVFALSNFMVSRVVAGHLNLVMPFAWAPWVLRAALRTVRGECGAWASLGLCAGMELLAGHVQISFFVAPVVAAFALFEAKRTNVLGPATKRLLAGGALALGVAAIQWIPAAELFAVSGHPAEDPRVIVGCSAPVSALAAQIAPRFGLEGTHEQFVHEFSGLGGLLAVAAALLAFRPRDGRRVFWFVVLAAGLVLATGYRNEFGRLANELPPFRFARAPGRALTLVVLAGGVLAGYAVADGFEKRGAWARAAVPVALAASALLVGLPTVDVVKSDFYELEWGRLLPADAAGRKVHVLHGRWPYLEREGIATLRDVCPLDTPGYKALTNKESASSLEIARCFDLGAQLDPPQRFEPPPPGAPAGAGAIVVWTPPADQAATLEEVRETRVKSFAAAGEAQFFPESEAVSDDEALARLRAGERKAFLPASSKGAAGGDAAPRFSVETLAPDRLRVVVHGEPSGWIVLARKWYPGWTGSGVVRGNLAFLALPLTSNEIEIAYRPWWKWPALLASLTSLVLGVAVVVRARRAGAPA